MHRVRIGHVADLVVEGIAGADDLTLPEYVVLIADGVLVICGIVTKTTVDGELLVNHVWLGW